MNETQSKFLQMAVPAAQSSQKATGIPASITIAQAILESGWGCSALAREANNYFGIKATAHVNPSRYAEFQTSEFVDGRKTSVLAKFARYESPAESFAAHASLIAKAPRYAAAMRFCAKPEIFAHELQVCGYSTLEDSQGNHIYAQRLMELVNEFDLTQYDLPPMPDAPAAAQAKEKAA